MKSNRQYNMCWVGKVVYLPSPETVANVCLGLKVDFLLASQWWPVICFPNNMYVNINTGTYLYIYIYTTCIYIYIHTDSLWNSHLLRPFLDMWTNVNIKSTYHASSFWARGTTMRIKQPIHHGFWLHENTWDVAIGRVCLLNTVCCFPVSFQKKHWQSQLTYRS